jgi:hypothetical protein
VAILEPFKILILKAQALVIIFLAPASAFRMSKSAKPVKEAL